jgi:hypothetical protein
MNAFNKFRNKVFKSKDKKSLHQEVEEEHTPKSFQAEWTEAYEIAKSWAKLPNSLSIASSSLIFVSAFPNIHWVFAIMIGLLPASLYEWLKNYISYKGWNAYYMDKAIGLLFVAHILYAGSIFFSVFGAYNGYKLMEGDTKQEVTQVTAAERAIKVAEYDTLIIKAETAAEKFRTGALWKGSLGNNAKTYGEMAAKISDLQEEKRAALAKLDQKHSTTLSEAVEDLGLYIYVLIGFALFNEGLIMLGTWFKKYYRWRVYSDKKILEEPEEVSMSLNELRAIVESVLGIAASPTLPTAQVQATQQVQVRGFQVGQGQQTATPVITHNPAPTAPIQTPTFQAAAAPIVPPVQATAPQPLPKVAHYCENEKCKKEYNPTAFHQKYCSQNCRWEANNFTKIKNKKI